MIKYYVDADTLGLARVLERIRGDVTYPGDEGGRFKRTARPPCPITDPGTPDLEWLPVVASHGWLVLTRDQALSRRPAEIAAIVEDGAKVVAIVGATNNEKLDTFRQLEILMINWRRIEPLVDLPGPFVYTASRSGLRRITA